MRISLSGVHEIAMLKVICPTVQCQGLTSFFGSVATSIKQACIQFPKKRQIY